MLGNSVAVVVVVRTRPRVIPLAMISMSKSTHGFLFPYYMSMGLRLAAIRAAGAPLQLLVIRVTYTANNIILYLHYLLYIQLLTIRYTVYCTYSENFTQ